MLEDEDHKHGWDDHTDHDMVVRLLQKQHLGAHCIAPVDRVQSIAGHSSLKTFPSQNKRSCTVIVPALAFNLAPMCHLTASRFTRTLKSSGASLRRLVHDPFRSGVTPGHAESLLLF